MSARTYPCPQCGAPVLDAALVGLLTFEHQAGAECFEPGPDEDDDEGEP